MRNLLLTLIILLVVAAAPFPALAASLTQTEPETSTPVAPAAETATAEPLQTTAPPPTEAATAVPPTATQEATQAPPQATSTPEPPADTDEPPTEPPEKLSLTGLEPDSVNGETGGVISVYGTGFVPGIVVRLVGHGILDAAVLNSTAMRLAVPPGLVRGSYTLEIILPDGASHRFENVLTVTRPKKEKPTPTPTPGQALVYGQPQIVIESSVTDPEKLRPGAPFDLTLRLINRGDYTANNVRVSLASPELVVPRQGGNLVVVDKLASAQTVELNLPLALSESAGAGYHSLSLAIEYSDGYGRAYTSTQSVGLDAGDQMTDQPMLLLNSYRTEPEMLSPGDAFTLKMEIVNVGSSDAGNLMLSFGGEAGPTPSVFALLGSGNVKYISRLEAGASMEVEQRFALDGAAASGVYNLPIQLAFDGPNQERRTENQVLNLLVNRRPQFRISFYRPVEGARANEPLTLPVEVVNIGRNMVNVSTVELVSDAFEIESGTTFVGALDGGTAGTLDAQVTPLRGGSLPVTVRVNYLDDFNQPQVITQSLTVEVEAAEAPPEGADPQAAAEGEKPEENWFVRLIRGIFGLGS